MSVYRRCVARLFCSVVLEVCCCDVARCVCFCVLRCWVGVVLLICCCVVAVLLVCCVVALLCVLLHGIAGVVLICERVVSLFAALLFCWLDGLVLC